MKLNTIALANAAAIVTAVLFTLCALFLAAFQEHAYLFFSFLFHVDLTSSAYPMSWGVFVGSGVVWVIGMWIVAAVFAGLYNAMIRQQP